MTDDFGGRVRRAIAKYLGDHINELTPGYVVEIVASPSLYPDFMSIPELTGTVCGDEAAHTFKGGGAVVRFSDYVEPGTFTVALMP